MQVFAKIVALVAVLANPSLSLRLATPNNEADETICTVTPDWLNLECDKEFNRVSDETINAINGETHQLLPAYAKYQPYSGDTSIKDGNLIDFMGFKIPYELYCNKAYINQVDAHALRVRQCKMYDEMKRRNISKFASQWPVASEEYFEYSDVLDAVSDYEQEQRTASEQNKRKFVFVELGAGYGHWTFAAHKALMQKMPEAEYKYLLVDVVNELLPEISNLATLNGVHTTQGKDSPLQFHHGFIGGNEAHAHAMDNIYNDLWGLTPSEHKEPLEPISLTSLFEAYDAPCKVDMVDIDIQGSEYDLLDDKTMDLLTSRVRRVHIGTHEHKISEKNDALLEKFEKRGWIQVWNFPPKTDGGRYETPHGPIAFGDGVISYKNPATICA